MTSTESQERSENSANSDQANQHSNHSHRFGLFWIVCVGKTLSWSVLAPWFKTFFPCRSIAQKVSMMAGWWSDAQLGISKVLPVNRRFA